MENQSQITASKHKMVHSEKDHELNHWSKKFGISRDELLKAEQSGETSANAVEKYVKRLGHK
jgi:hypothetical protein